ncbi:MAG: hypothetical protein R3B48_25915 [Kofleriaceae bacterium]
MRIPGLLAPSATPVGPSTAPREDSERGQGRAAESATPPAPQPDVPWELREQLARSIRNSQRRLRRADGVLSALRAAISATASALLTRPGARGVAVPIALGDAPRAATAGVMTELNTRSADGEFVLAGDAGAPALFAVDGSYLGRALEQVIVMSPGMTAGLALAASALTCRAPLAGAVDVLALLAHACAPGARLDEPARMSLRSKLVLAAAQVEHVQRKLDSAMDMLARADADTPPPTGEPATPSSAALPHLFTAVEAARSLAERALSVIPPSS